MKKAIFLILVLAWPVLTSYGQNIVTAAQVNGTWRHGKDEIKVLALGGGKLKVEYSGTYEYKINGNWNANTGEAKGFAAINGITAIFTDSETAECKMTLKFVRAKLIVKNDGCGFGVNVDSSGTYNKINAKKPRFDW